MTPPVPVTTAIIVPARNEAERIGECLRSMAVQDVRGLCIVLVANNCVDDTVAVARRVAGSVGLHIDILDCALPESAGVGTARRLGCTRALATHPDLAALLTTDADCMVAPDWVARNLHHLHHAAAVCGLVEPMAAELSVLRDIDVRPAEMEARYEQLVIALYRHFRPGPCGLDGDHGAAAGASLAIRKAAYLAVGCFADIATGEDRDLVRRLKQAGHGVWHGGDVRVEASCRLHGRARGGMAQALQARAARTDYVIDDSLPPAEALVAAAIEGRLGPWPLHVAPGDRLHARELAPHIALLERALETLTCVTPREPPYPASAVTSAPRLSAREQAI